MLGLKLLNGKRMLAVVVRRAPEGFELQKTVEFALAGDPLKDNPEQVGAEIRQHLDRAGIRESRCVVCIPLNWVLTLQTDLPDLPEADLQSFLDVQAERMFPFAPEDLHMALSRYRISPENRQATLAAVPRNKLSKLEETLSAAGLRAASISIGLSNLQPPDPEGMTGAIALLAGKTGIDLQITAGGGVVVLRALEASAEIEDSMEDWDPDSVAKQIRITMGQLPDELRNTLREIRVFGTANLVQSMIRKIQPFAERLGLSVEAELSDQLVSAPPDVDVPAICPSILKLTIQRLRGGTPVFEFLPPKVHQFQEWTHRFSTRQNLYLGGAAAAILAILFIAFQVQGWRLSRLETAWEEMEPRVTEIEALQEKLRRFRPWFDPSVRSLVITKHLTEAFPEEGSVWVKMLEIRNRSEVRCAGFARNNDAWMTMRNRLQEMPQIQDLKVTQVQGENLLEFSFNFRWSEGGAL